MQVKTTTKPFVGTWLDRPGKSWELREAGAAGRRIMVHQWDDDPQWLEVRVIRGNFLKGTGQVLQQTTRISSTDLDAWAANV